ncbi:hypothetical protein AB9E11_35570, partial [Rhizobium leguminosarum]
EAEPLLSELPRLLKTYPYYVCCGVGMEQCDTLVLSKLPLIEPRIRNLGLLWRNRLTISTIDFDVQKVNLHRIMEGKTVLAIAHRLSTIA